MTETMTKAAIDVQAPPQEAPAAQLPAVRQERRPRAPAGSKPVQFSSSIARAILAVSSEIGVIQKEGWNDFQKYKYTRWEDINEKLSPLLHKNNLIIVQSEQNRSLLEENDKGSVLAIVYHFTIVNSDGEQWPPTEWTGIARLRDAKGTTDDKAAIKCHTQAEKFFCVKQFKIVTDDFEKGDRHQSLPKKDARDIYKKLQAEIDELATLVELSTWGTQNSERLKTLPPDWQDILRERYVERRQDLENVVTQSGEVWADDHDATTGEVIDPPEPSPRNPAIAADREPAPVNQGTPAGAGEGPSIEDQGRTEAKRGEVFFNDFYKLCDAAERKRLNAIGDELRGYMNAAKETA